MNTAAEAGVWAELSRTLFVHFFNFYSAGDKNTDNPLCYTRRM